MSVRARDGFYHIDFRWRGKRYRLSTAIPDTQENENFVKDWNATIRREIGMGTFQIEAHFPKLAAAKPAPGTFKDAAEAWLKAHKSAWAEWTYRKHRDNLQSRVYPKIGNLPKMGIKPVQLRQLRSDIIEEGKRIGGKLSNRSVNRIMTPVLAIFNELFADGEIESNPAARVTKLKEKRIAEIDPFTDQELARLFETAKKHSKWYYPYVRNLFESGFRLEEHNGLQWQHINLAIGVVQIREVMALRKLKPPKTEHAIRDAEMTDGMRQCYIEQKSRSYLKGKFVWVTTRGHPIDVSNFRAAIWEPLLKKAKLRYRWPNQARHTFATRHISTNTDPTWIAKQMGTSLQQLFESYTAEFSRLRGHVRGHAPKKLGVKY